jgi:hypothetical protein
MTAEYIRQIGTQTWHFCLNCSGWPEQDYVTLSDLPRTHEMCNECISKKELGECGNFPREPGR